MEHAELKKLKLPGERFDSSALEPEISDPGVVAILLLLGWLLATMVLWWFALSGVSSGIEATSADWLQKARAVCFGTDESGLPNSAGWIVLTLGPLSFLSMLAIGMKDELLANVCSMLKTFPGKLIVLSAAMAIAFQVRWVSAQVTAGIAIATADYSAPDAGYMPESYPLTNKEAPRFSLVDQHGNQQSVDSLSGKTTIITFAFAHCRTVCPALVATARAALENLPQDSTALVIVSLDPWRDTPGSLPSLAKKWNLPLNAFVLSGAVADVTDVISRYEIPTARSEVDGDITHPGVVYVVNSQGQISYTLNNPPRRWLEQAVQRSALETS